MNNEYIIIVFDVGFFYYGIKVDLKFGDLFIVGFNLNYCLEIVMNYIYFIVLVGGVGLVVVFVVGEGCECVYIVELIGEFENDLNVIDKKFFGNFICFYCSIYLF